MHVLDDAGAALAVTPGGLPAGGWREVVDAAGSVSVSELAAELTAALGPGEPLLVTLSAHPDDETIGAGALIAAWDRAGHPSAAVLATAGEACLDHVAPRPPDLAARRLAEWDAALDRLGVAERYLLGLPDGRLAAYEDELTASVADLLTRLTADHAVLLAAPHPEDPHPDHQAAGRAAVRAFGSARAGVVALGYPVWMPYWSDPRTAPPARLLSTDPADEARRDEALRCFATQLEPLGPGLTPVVPPDLLDRHRAQLLFPLSPAGGGS